MLQKFVMTCKSLVILTHKINKKLTNRLFVTLDSGTGNSYWWPHANPDKPGAEEKQICEKNSTIWRHDLANSLD